MRLQQANGGNKQAVAASKQSSKNAVGASKHLPHANSGSKPVVEARKMCHHFSGENQQAVA